METRPLGNSGVTVSVIGLGAWAMGGTVETWGEVDDRESIAAIQQALECGINLIDTAPIYGLGHSEEIVGKAISGCRDKFVVATKCGLLFPRSAADPPARSLAPESIYHEFDSSLRRLRTDYIDLYQCHWPDPHTPIRETMAALTSLLDKGAIRAIGLSNFSCEEITLAREYGPVHSLQPPFSMLHRRAAADLLPYCQEHGIAALPYSPLAKGLLTGKFHADSRLEGIRAKDPEFLGARYRRNLAIVDGLRPIAERIGKTLAQLVLQWTISQPGVTSALVGAKRPTQVLENAGGAGWCLPEGENAEIAAVLEASTRDA